MALSPVVPSSRRLVVLTPWVVMLAAIWAPVIYLLGAQWSVYDQYNYGWAVPFLCLFLAAQKKTSRLQDYKTTDYGAGGGDRTAAKQKLEDRRSKIEGTGGPSSSSSFSLPVPEPVVRGQESEVRPPTSDLGSPISVPPSPPISDFRSPISLPRPVVLSLLVTASLLYWLMRVLQEANPIWRLASYGLALAAVAMTLSLIYLIHGRARMAQFVFPITFFLIAVPWPTPLEAATIQTLTQFNSSLVTEVLGFVGIPALLHGNVIEISTGLVGIDEACSGIRSLQATLMIALFFGAFYQLTWERRWWLLAAGPALAMAFNLARTLTLVLVASRAGLPAMEKWHDPTGVALLLGCFLSLWAVAVGLGGKQKIEDRRSKMEEQKQKMEDRRSKIEGIEGATPPHHLSSIIYPLSSSSLPAPTSAPVPPPPGPEPIFDLRSSIFACLLASWSLTVTLSTEAWFRSHEARGHGNDKGTVSWAAHWPTANPMFQTNVIPPNALRMLQCDQNSSASWSESDSGNANGDTGVFWQAFYLRWLPAESFYGRAKVALSKSHNPAICLTAAGMKLRTQLDPVALPVRPNQGQDHGLGLNLNLTFDRFVFDVGGRELFVFFSQTEDLTEGGQANLRMTHLARLRAALTGSRNYGERNFEVALTGPESPTAALALFQARLPDLIEVNPR